MRLFVGDFLGDTTTLDQREVGAYMLILMAMWQSPEGRLPNDPRKIKLAARGGRDWPAVWASIRHYFHIDNDGFLANKRLTLERVSRTQIAEVNAQNGARGGRPKSLKAKDATKADGSNSLNPEESYTRVHSPEKIQEGDKPPPESSGGGEKRKKIEDGRDGRILMAVSAFNKIASEVGWPLVKTVSDTRGRRLLARIEQAGGLAEWLAQIRRGASSSFLRGEDGDGWKADFDFFLQERSFVRLMEGSYDRDKSHTKRMGGRGPENIAARGASRPGERGPHRVILDGFAAAAGVSAANGVHRGTEEGQE